MTFSVKKTKLAYDKSMRSYDHDGRLHIELTPISKSNVCPYYGKEIPNSEALGLEPNKIYQMFRDPEELRKAAETSNNIQLMQVHDPVTPDEPKQMKVVGSTGTDAIFEPPYLKNSLAVWTKSAINWIETGAKKQLSSAYHYVADMTPGVWLGAQYDGVMRDIKFNHVAIVEDGRAGADVMVVDSLPAGLAYDHMPFSTGDRNKMLTSRALIGQQVVKAILQPMLAQDAQIDYKRLLLGSTALNWDEAKPQIMGRIKAATKGKLAKDANLEIISKALDVLGSDEDMDGMDEDEEDEKKEKAKDKKAKDEKEDDDGDEDDEDEKVVDKKKAKDRKAKDEKEDEEEMKSKDKKAKDKKGKDEWPDKDEEDDEDEKAKDKKAKDVMPVKAITKRAMDEAIKIAQDEAIEQTRLAMRKEQRELREAEQIVKPILGELIAQDSALEVYDLLFKDQGVEVKGVTKTVPNYRALAQVTVKAATKPKAKQPMAHDSKAIASMEERFGIKAVRSI